MPMRWFRVYSELLQDRKIGFVARNTGIDKQTVIGTWVSLLCLASDSSQRGRLFIAPGLSYTTKGLALELDLDPAILQSMLDNFTDLGMMHLNGTTWCITKWDERQFSSDNATARWRKWKERQEEPPSQVEEDPESEDITNVGQTYPSSGVNPICSDLFCSSSVSDSGLICSSSDSETMDERQKGHKLRQEFLAFVGELCSEKMQLIPLFEQQAQLVGREDGVWLLAHNPRLIDTLQARVPRIYERLLESCRFVNV